MKGTTATPKVAKKKDRRSSPAVRAKLAAAARARWAKVRAAVENQFVTFGYVGTCNADASRRTRKTVHFRQDARISVPD